MPQEVHIGHIIQDELHRQGRSVTWLAQQLPCNRRNVYDIFRRKSLDTDLLMRLSRLLHYDFFRHFQPLG